MISGHSGILLTAICNLILAMNGEKEPEFTEPIIDIADRLNRMAADIREKGVKDGSQSS